MISRIFKLQDAETESIFFFGARQTGKTTLLKKLFPATRYYDLLNNEQFERLGRHPELLREDLQDMPADIPAAPFPSAAGFTGIRTGFRASGHPGTGSLSGISAKT